MRGHRIGIRRAIALVALVITLGALAYALVPSSRRAPPRNLVLISIDTLAPRRTSVYGGPRDNTPTLAMLAARGVRFTNAFSTASWTAPAHASMLTGRYPSTIHAGGPRANALYHLAPRLLAEDFEAAGFQTAAFTGGGWVSKALGANRGFQSYEEGSYSYVRMPGPVEWIKQRGRERRFFYFYHTYIAHVPYRDERYAKDLDPGRLKAIWGKEDWDPERNTWRLPLQICCEGMEPTPEEREFLLARYDGDIAQADEAVRQIWDALGEIGAQDDTMVIITSDHGEEFWEHTGSGARHGHTLYDELVRIPLIWVEAGWKARTSDAPVSLIDIVPTILARFGLPAAAGMDGRDLTPILDGWRRRWPERALFAEEIYGDAGEGPLRWRVTTEHGTLIETPEPQIQRGKFKMAPSAPRELFLPADPAQVENRIDAEAALAASLAADLAAHRTRREIAGPHQPWSAISPELIKQLRALGYMQ